MFKVNLRTSDESRLVRQQVAALEHCACQGLQAAQSLSETSFVMEDMAAMLPFYPGFDEESEALQSLLNVTAARTMDPSIQTSQEAPRVLPALPSTSHQVSTEYFQEKAVQFSKNVVKIAGEVSHKVQKAYLWLTTHQSDIGKHLRRVDGGKSNVRDATVVIRGWSIEDKEVKTVEDAISAAQIFLDKQLPALLNYCEHSLFVMKEAQDVMDDALSGKVNDHKLTSLYKAHTKANIERIFHGQSNYPVLGSREVAVTESDTRARNDNEKIVAVTAVQVIFEKVSGPVTPHNTPSATSQEADKIVQLCEKILAAVDITEPKNSLGVLQRDATHFEKQVAKLEDVIRKNQLEQSDEEEQHYRTIVDLSRMLSILRLQAANFGVSTYTSATDVVEKLLTLVKLKD